LLADALTAALLVQINCKINCKETAKQVEETHQETSLRSAAGGSRLLLFQLLEELSQRAATVRERPSVRRWLAAP
jgi:hypothetical protein